MATHKDLRIVFIQGTLVITNSRHVLDNNRVVGVFVLLVQNLVGRHHIVHYVGLGDLLGAELLLGAQILAVVVAQMVIASDGSELDASVDQEVNESRFHLGLARLEVITTNESALFLCKVNRTGNKGVLRGTVNERGILQDASYCENGGRGDLLVA